MSAHSKDNSTAAERYVYIGQLSWEKQNKKRQKQPQERSQKVEFSAGKANSTIAAAATATTTTVVVGGKQTKKNSKRQRQVSELCE
jgi:hypothetical protein